MKKRKITMKKSISMLVVVALLITCLPMYAMAADTDSARVADDSTMDGWKDIFLADILSTENAGGVWTDKSVFTDATAFAETGIRMNENDNFLIALSAIASNITKEGMMSSPTDTMLILDVSGSMNDNNGNNDVAEELVEAANTSIAELLSANKYNRVGVVLYSGTSASQTNDDAAILMLPLGRYTTAADGQYLNYDKVTNGYGWNNETTETVSLDSDVVIEGTSAKPTNRSKEVVGATYIQKGIILAKDQFTAASNTTTIQGADGTIKRKPVVVLMSDGAPTLSSTDFTSPGQYNMGDGKSSSISAAQGFVTQLSAAYAKQQIEEKYDTDCLFYTLGLGVSSDSIATSVLNPGESSVAINDFWDAYHEAKVGASITVQVTGRNTRSVTKISETLEQNYVDEYFAVDNSADGGLAQGLKDAFRDIVGTIQLQSKYFPTLISESEEHSGYITFVDRVGEYMEVKDVKGILIHNTLFSGADLASNFAEGEDALDIYAESVIGNEMIHAVQQRLGIDDGDDETEDDLETARTLIKLAHTYGQLSYKNADEYSNYIGWYANAAGEFLGFYQEGVTELKTTESTDTNPVFTIKSYGYFGEVDEEHGVAKTDMMFATVQVRTNIQTSEQIVTFAIPAALVPIITYNVTLDENKNLTDLAASGAEHPIRLVYEVGLKNEINEFTIKDRVSAEYLAENTNADGSVSFYTNQYDHSNTTGYNTVNTYSYFNPSRQNEQYYHLEDAPIYVDDKGTLYSGESKPTGEMYRSYTVYKKDGANLLTDTVYRKLDVSVLEGAEQTEGTTNWHIPKGYVHVNTEGYTIEKDKNLTNTLPQVNIPFVDTHNHNPGDLGYSFYVGATLGNNGKITLVPETGIKITKEMKADATTPDAPFTFVITNESDATDTNYPAYLITADGTMTETSVMFENGKATVTLNPKDTLYIGRMTAGDVITVEETETADYIVESVNQDSSLKVATITLVAQELMEAHFVNADRRTGNLTIAKEVEHGFGLDYQIPADKSFEITVTLSGVGTANATYEASKTNSTITSVTTDNNGQFTITLKHDEQFEVFGLPEGTKVVVVEENPGTGFEPKYWDKGLEGDGIVDIEGDTTVSVIVVNDYTSAKVYPVNITVSGTKTLTGRDWMEDDVFTFELQKQTGEDQWTVLGTAEVKGTDADKDFDFNGAFVQEEYTQAGTYYYRVVEIEPTTGALGGVIYDKSVHAFAVDVADADMDGQLEISQVRSFRDSTHVTQPDTNSWHVDVDFINSYAASGMTAVTIDLNKKVTNESGSTLATLFGFTFGLFDGDGNLVYESAPTTDRGFARLVLEFTREGIYEYTLKEMIPTEIPEGWTYSNKEIPVTIEVTDSGAGYYTAVIYEGTTKPADAGTSISTEFTNIYQPKEAELVVDFVEKRILGRTLKTDEFTFEVQKTDGTTVLKGTNDAEGNVNFEGILKFDKVDTYYFNIVETSGDGKGVTSDKTVYRIIVTVTDQAGKLNASYVLVNAVEDNIVFQNTYKADEVTYQVGGSKTLKGRALLNDEFIFVMTEVADARGSALSGAKTYETTNRIDGSVAFEAITYTEAGTYYYLVSEKADSGNTHGIVYDKTEYIVTVEITDNEEGKLEVSQVSYVKDGKDSADSITFENEYVPSPTSAQIPGNKNLTGKVLSGDDFEFTLYDSDANWNEGDKRETVKNAKDGSFVFETIDYDKADSYYYLVKEVNGGEVINGINYDATTYRVRIDVKDDLKGNLTATIHIYDQYDIPQESILFENLYEITGTGSVTLEGEKTLNGRDMADGEFTFELYETGEEFEVSATAKNTTVNTDGKFDFTIDYTADDVGKTFYYVVKEANAGNIVDGILYSATEYQITVVVEDNEVGGVKTTTTIKDGTLTVSNLDFINECVGDLVITKEVDYFKDGNEIQASLDNREDIEYSFTVIIGDQAPVTFTLKNGESKTFEDILYGTAYTVTEDTTGSVFTSEITNGTGTIASETTTVEVVNRYDYVTYNLGLHLVKADSETKQPLSGAEFGIYEDAECTKEIATAISDASGNVHFEIPAEGTYYLKETKAPEGYYLSEKVYTITAEMEYVAIIPETAKGEETITPYIEERMMITADALEGATEDGINYTYIIDNTRIGTVDVSVRKEWKAPAGVEIPESIEVVLYQDGEVYETISLTAAGNWSYQWIGLSEEFTWTVDEVKVPYGFAKKVESEGLNFTITNTYTETIKNTGENMMPTIYGITLLLAGMGVVFTAVKLRKEEETA